MISGDEEDDHTEAEIVNSKPESISVLDIKGLSSQEESPESDTVEE